MPPTRPRLLGLVPFALLAPLFGGLLAGCKDASGAAASAQKLQNKRAQRNERAFRLVEPAPK